jgi:hypothetical protein
VPKPSEAQAKAQAKASHKLCTKRYEAFLKSLK